MKSPLLTGLAGFLLLAATVAAAEQSSGTVTFSDASKPGKLEIRLGSGNLVVRAVDGNTVTVTSQVESANKPRADGLRVLTSAAGFSLSEKDNTARLEYGGVKGVVWVAGNGVISGPAGNPGPADFDVAVPRNASVVITMGGGGHIDVTGLTGDVDVSTSVGDVKLAGLRGGAVVQSSGGSINAAFAALGTRPVSLTSTRGTVEVRIPADTKANVRLRTFTGEILTDFDERALATRMEQVPANSPLVLQKEQQVRQVEQARQVEQVSQQAEQLKHQAEADAMLSRLNAERQQALQSSAKAKSEVDSRMTEARTAMERAAIDAQAAKVTAERIAVSIDENGVAFKRVIPSMTGGKLVTGTLNGGGPEINITTMNGDVTLRKSAP